MRGTAAVAARATDELERDLFLLRESAEIDAAIARSVRNVAPALAAARADALTRRPLIESLAGAERDVERLVRQLLEADPSSPPPALASRGTAEESLAWARGAAERMRAAPDRYRGVAPVDVWGRVLPPAPSAVLALEESGGRSLMSSRFMNLVELAGAEPSGQRRPVPAERGAAPKSCRRCPARRSSTAAWSTTTSARRRSRESTISPDRDRAPPAPTHSSR